MKMSQADVTEQTNRREVHGTVNLRVATAGLFDDRGNFDASGNAFPNAGGSGDEGAILKADTWTVSVAGILGGVPVRVGDLVRARIDTPGQTLGNWYITESGAEFSAAAVSALPAIVYPPQPRSFPALVNAMRVTGAGDVRANSDYFPTGNLLNARPVFGGQNDASIFYQDDIWQLHDADENFHFNGEDAETPADVTTWTDTLATGLAAPAVTAAEVLMRIQNPGGDLSRVIQTNYPDRTYFGTAGGELIEAGAGNELPVGKVLAGRGTNRTPDFIPVTGGRGISISASYAELFISSRLSVYPDSVVDAETLDDAKAGLLLMNSFFDGSLITAHLPDIQVSETFAFLVTGAGGLKIVAAAGQKIRIAGSISAAAGFIKSTVIGSSIVLVGVADEDGTHPKTWYAINSLGTWTIDA